MTSRKFIVWISATVFEVGFLILGFITNSTDLALQFIPWWGGISMIYIGGNVAQKFVPKDAEEIPEIPIE